MVPSAETEEVSTIFITGFPEDATARELDLVTRFMPGFVGTKTCSKKYVTLFAKFDSPDNAMNAINVLNEQKFDRTQEGRMRAQMARSNVRKLDNMDSAFGQQLGTAAPTPAVTPVVINQGPPTPFGGKGAGKRKRIAEDPNSVDTVAVIGAVSQGYDEAGIADFFSSLQGFVAFKPMQRVGGGFVKFASQAFALEAIASAQGYGIPAELAKSSMSVEPNEAGAQEAFSSDADRDMQINQPTSAAFESTFPAKRARTECAVKCDTVACVGAADAGFDEAALKEFFEAQEGFLAFRGMRRLGGGFIKYASVEHAAMALNAAVERGIPAEPAKSSMNAS